MYARNGERELARRVRIEQRMQMQLEDPDDLADLEGFGGFLPGMAGFHRDREMFERRARDAGRQQVLLEQAQQEAARRAGLEQRLASAAARRDAEVAQVREAEVRARTRDERRRVINQALHPLAPSLSCYTPLIPFHDRDPTQTLTRCWRTGSLAWRGSTATARCSSAARATPAVSRCCWSRSVLCYTL